MRQRLLRFYVLTALPVLGALILLFVLDRMGIDPFGMPPATRARTVGLLFLSAALAVVLPLWYRIYFVRQMGPRRAVPAARFFAFQRGFLLIALASLYVVPVAFLMKVPRTPMLLISLLGFYAAYFYFPSRKRISSEVRLFRVESD